jgi:ribosomal protein L7Ae-like RNA K-turn-binding protein
MSLAAMTNKPDIYIVSERFFGMLGMCRRAGKTVLGTEMICSQMREKRKPVLVLISSGASENTLKRLIDKSNFYGIPYLVVDVDGELLAARLGKTGFLAAVAVSDSGFASEIRNACKRRESSDEEDGSPIGNCGAADGADENDTDRKGLRTEDEGHR